MDFQKIDCIHSALNPVKEGQSIVIDLERSKYIQKRKEHLKTLKVPTITDILSKLGKDLSGAIFTSYQDNQLRDIGLIPPLDGAGPTLWKSPSDLLIGKVCLKPPFTSKHIQALTHQGIMEIGKEIEQKYWNQMELEKELALTRQKAELLYCFEKELNKSLLCLGVKLQAECSQKIDLLTKEFEIILVEELNKLEAELRIEFNKELQGLKDEISRQEILCEKTIEEAIQRTVKKMTVLFLEDLEKQHDVLCEYFANELKRWEIKRFYDKKMDRLRWNEVFNQMKHHLECKNIANMMYILCMEREKCNTKKALIEKHYKKEISLLTSKIEKQEYQIKILREERRQRTAEVKLREKCIMDILKHFQKFINYALKAAPAQAEFLLSVERLMMFELAENVQSAEEAKKPYPYLYKWKKGDESSTSKESLTVEDYHDCFNELDPPVKYNLDDIKHFPSFYFKKRFYVREDFRNMISQGIEIKPDNELWSKEVDILIETLKESVSDLGEEQMEHEEEEKKEAVQPIFNTGRKRTTKYQVSFQSDSFSEPHDKKYPSSDASVVSDLRVLPDIKPCSGDPGKLLLEDHTKVLETIRYDKIGTEEKRKFLLATADSLDISKKKLKHVEKKTTSEVSTDIETIDQVDMQDYKSWLKYLDAEKGVEYISASDKSEEDESKAQVEADIAHKAKSKHLDSRVCIAVSLDSKLALATRDSIIYRKLSMQRDEDKLIKGEILPEDHENIEVASTKSKIELSRDSTELIRKSFSSLRVGCTKCKCSRKSSLAPSFSLRMRNASNVSFKHKPDIYDLDKLETIYKEEMDTKPEKPKKIKPKCEKIAKKTNKCKIIGDKRAKEYLQEPQEFTDDRIRSFVNLIKDNPFLIRMYTSCAR